MTTTNRSLATLLYPIGLLLIAMATIQTGASLAKGLFPVVGAQGATALRLIFSSIILLALFKPWRSQWTPRSLRNILFYGMALGFMNLLYYLAIRTVPLGIAVALEFTGPLAVALFGSRRAIDFLWIALAVVGLVLLMPAMGSHTSLDPVGMAYALGAGACWAAYIIFGKKAGDDHGVQGAVLGVVVAAIFVVPVGIVHAGAALFSLSLLPVAMGVAILSTAIPYTLEMIALTRMPARTFGILMSIEPVAGALAGFLFLSEVLTLTQWLAIMAIIVASVGTTLTSQKEPAATLAAD
jgi:inner membrane transporter RhtA